MKKSITVLMFLFFVSYPFNCYAENCDSATLNDLKALAEKVNVSVTYDEEALNDRGVNESKVTVTGILSNDIYAMTRDGSSLFTFDDNVDGSIVETVTTLSDELDIYSDLCPGKVLRKIPLSLKKYNKYYESEECAGIKDGELDVCNKYYDGDLTEEQFKAKVNKYKNNVVVAEEDANKLSVSNFISNVKDNLVVVIIIGVVIIGVIGFLIYKRYKDNILE